MEGLLGAEPTVGWRRGGPVLTLDVAVRALLAARLGFDDPPDAGTLLDWSRGSGPARFRALPAEERAGLTAWLCGTVGGVAGVLMALVADGRAADVMALGIVAAVLDEPRASAETAVAVGGLLGATRIDPAERRAFVAAVEGTLERWVSAAEDGGAPGEDARRRFLAVVDRADRLAADAGLTDALARNAFLPSAFRTRLRAVAAALPPPRTPLSWPVRQPPSKSSAGTGSRGSNRTGAWRRRWPFACSGGSRRRPQRPCCWSPRRLPPMSPMGDGWTGRSTLGGRGRAPRPGLAQAYRTVFDAARRRRTSTRPSRSALAWVAQGHRPAGGALPIEEVLEEVAVPLRPKVRLRWWWSWTGWARGRGPARRGAGRAGVDRGDAERAADRSGRDGPFGDR